MSFKEQFKQLNPRPSIDQLRERLDTLEQSGGGGSSDELDEIRDRLSAVERSGGGGGSGGDTVTVLDYGASGGGSKNDGPAIQDALKDAARSDGESIVRFPNGRYFSEETILIPSNVSLRGAGMGNATIQGALNGEATLELDNCENVEFTGLTFTKEAEPDNSDSWYFFGTGDNVRFNRCEWRDLPRQGGLFRGSDYHISDCRIRDTGRDGFLFVGVNRPIVSNCHFYRTGDDSIAFNTDTSNGVAVGNVVEASGYHHAGGGVKQHGNNCVVTGNVFIRPNTYAIRIQNPDEIGSDESPWPDRDIFANNVVNGMNSSGGSNNYAVEVKALNGEALIANNAINTATDDGENRRGMRIRGTGPESHVTISGGSISMDPDADSKYAIVLENDLEHIKIEDVSFYHTSDMVRKRKASTVAGDCEIRDCYFDPGESKQLFDCVDDDGFETLRVRGNTSKSPGSELVNCGDAEFDFVQVHDNMARDQSLTSGMGSVDDVVTGPL